MNIDDNVIVAEDGSAYCAHCNHPLGAAGTNPLARALRREAPSAAAGPGIHADASSFCDRPIVLRQISCPNCLVLMGTEIAPADEPEYRTWRLER